MISTINLYSHNWIAANKHTHDINHNGLGPTFTYSMLFKRGKPEQTVQTYKQVIKHV